MSVSKLMDLVRTTDWNRQMNVDWFFQQQATGLHYNYCAGKNLTVCLVQCSIIEINNALFFLLHITKSALAKPKPKLCVFNELEYNCSYRQISTRDTRLHIQPRFTPHRAMYACDYGLHTNWFKHQLCLC